jgi:peptidoglycan/xylan/chitin deacetylase (PgdA/CDA1 family)
VGESDLRKRIAFFVGFTFGQLAKHFCSQSMGILGTPVRVIPAAEHPTLYLTFDDGPHPDVTCAIQQLLDARQVPATFFLVAQRAVRHPRLVAGLVAAGHAIGNHSLDHAYHHYFRRWRHISQWISEAEAELTAMTGQPTVGFRPPVGIRTPEVAWALEDLKLPLVLWQIRFFDAVLPWRRPRAIASLRRTPPGAIVLLHDRHPAGQLEEFLATLAEYIDAAREQGFQFRALSRALADAAGGTNGGGNGRHNGSRG